MGEGRGQAKCVQGGGGGGGWVGGGGESRECFKVAYEPEKKNVFGQQNLTTFLFLYKRSYYTAICYCV